MNYGEIIVGFGKVGVELYRNFIPNGVFVGDGRGDLRKDLGFGWIIRSRIRVSDLNFRGVSGGEQLGVSAPLCRCLKM